MDADRLDTILFQMISNAGTARSSYINAVRAAKNGEKERAESLLEEGKNQFEKGQRAHMELIQKSAAGELDINEQQLLLIHAEDLLAGAEEFGILAEEFIELYQILHDKKIIS
jgi:PTS system cellobiose-specific IIA component